MKHFRMEIPQKYEAPAIEIFEVEVEKGFAAYAADSPSDALTEGNPSSSGPWPGGAWD